MVVRYKDEFFSFWACEPWARTTHDERHGFSNRRYLGTVACYHACSWREEFNDDGSGAPAGDTKVALVTAACSSYSTYCTRTISVAGLRSGRRTSLETSIEGGLPIAFDVTPAGTVVWMETTYFAVPADRWLRGLTLDGDELLFDRAADLHDMAHAGATLFWLRGGEAQSTPVP